MKGFMNSVWAMLVALLIYKGFNYVVDLDNEIKMNIGETVNVNDTRKKIIDYSLWDRTYILDDGSTISVDYVFNKD